MTRYQQKLSGFTLIELLVSLAIVAAVMAGTYSGFRGFSEATRAATNEVAVLEDVSVALNLLRRDLEVSGWGLPKATRVAGDDATGVQVAESAFGVDINGDGDADDTVLTDRLFVANGLKIITDTAPSPLGGYYPDGEVPPGSMLAVADAMADGGQKATLTAQSAGSVSVSTTNVNFDTESCRGWYSGINYNLVDIRANNAIIFGGKVSGGGFAVEGHRISSVGSTPANSKTCTDTSGGGHVAGPATSVSFTSGETVGFSYIHDSTSIAVPAVVWEVRLADDGVYWLYRNQHKVLSNVVDFQLAYGLDPEWDGLEWSASVMPMLSSDLKQRPEHHLDYLASDDPAYSFRSASSGGELSSYFGHPQEVIESLRTVWIRVTVLRAVAEQDSAAENTVATSYVSLVNLRN